MTILTESIRLVTVVTVGMRGGMVYAVNGLSPTITAGTHGWGMGYFIVYEDDDCDEKHSKSTWVHR